MTALYRIVLVASLLLSPLYAQTSAPSKPAATPKQAPAASPTPAKPGTADADDKDDDDDADEVGIKTQDIPKKAIEPRISASEAEELFKSVDDILKFASKDTELPIKSAVNRELATREQVQKYVEERLRMKI